MALEAMTCRELVEKITDYLEEALSEPNRLGFEAHLADCPYCRLYIEQMRLTIAALGRLRDDPPDRPATASRKPPPPSSGTDSRHFSSFYPL
jgi:anti-sigma factor RsiW